MVRLSIDPRQVSMPKDQMISNHSDVHFRSVDLDIPPDMRLTSQYRATLGHKACHDFAKKNAAFQ